MPMTDRNPESKPVRAWPGQDSSLLGCGGHLGLGGCGVGERGDLVLEASVATDAVQADERQRQQRGNDDEELEDLVVDRRREATERDVGQDDHRRDDERHPQGPAEQGLHDRPEEEEVDAGDEQARWRRRWR